MTDFKYSDVLRTLFPRGPIWAFRALGDAEKLIEVIGDAKEAVRSYLRALASVRDPALTPILPDLEREYGITPVSTLTEAERREILAGYVYARASSGRDDLEARLHAAGFTDLHVYHNHPIVDPTYYTSTEWSICCDSPEAVCGNENAYCGQTGVGGYVLANGKVFEDDGDIHDYVIPQGSETWPMVFFVGGDKTSAISGYVVFVDGDMEAADTSAWTAGNGAILAKDPDTVHDGLRALTVTGPGNDFSRQDVNLDERYAVDAWIMHDSGDGVLYSRTLRLDLPS